MIVDTHSHLNFSAYKNDLDEVIKKCLDNNIWMINVGSKIETSRKAVEITNKYKVGVYAAVGLHPIYVGAGFVKIKTDAQEGSFLVKEEIFDYNEYKKLALSGNRKAEGPESHRKVVAIGEIGLDYYYKPKTTGKLESFKKKQKEVFISQLKLAVELDLPVILHCRMAHQDLIGILKNMPKVKAVLHCFTGSWNEAKQYLDMGLYLGINGIMFKMDLSETISKAPIEKLLVETDCPYLIPPMARQSSKGGDSRNEPIFIKYIIEKIADLKNMTFDKVVSATTENAQKLFRI